MKKSIYLTMGVVGIFLLGLGVGLFLQYYDLQKPQLSQSSYLDRKVAMGMMHGYLNLPLLHFQCPKDEDTPDFKAECEAAWEGIKESAIKDVRYAK